MLIVETMLIGYEFRICMNGWLFRNFLFWCSECTEGEPAYCDNRQRGSCLDVKVGDYTQIPQLSDLETWGRALCMCKCFQEMQFAESEGA